MASRGRPTKYTDKLASEICNRLAAGESLRSICRTEDMPPESTIRGWVVDDVKGFSAQYARARDLGLDCMADEILDIADDDTEHPARTKIRFDARRWYLSKLAPKRYGEKQQLEHTGKDGGPIETNATIDPSKLSSAALRELVNARTEADE